MRKIHLHGHLAKYGGPFELDVATPAQAVQLLRANFPAFVTDLRGYDYRVVRGDLESGLELGQDEMALYLGTADLHFVPVAAGSGRGTGKIIAGIALVGLSFVPGVGQIMAAGVGNAMLGMGASAAVANLAVSATLYIAGSLGTIGAMLALGGVAKMLAPSPKRVDLNPSYAFAGFNSLANSSEQGAPVPVVYGRTRVGSVVASAGLDIGDESKVYHSVSDLLGVRSQSFVAEVQDIA